MSTTSSRAPALAATRSAVAVPITPTAAPSATEPEKDRMPWLATSSAMKAASRRAATFE